MSAVDGSVAADTTTDPQETAMAASRTTTDTPAVVTGDGGADVAPDVERTDGAYVVEVPGYDDGETTFSRPGVDDALTLTVSAGKISTTQERAAWLVRYAGANPVTADTKE